jgi:hypothetical protein
MYKINNMLLLVIAMLVYCGPSGGDEGPDAFSVEVEQITSGPRHHFFGYIGHGMTIPWNGDGRYIVALRADFYKRMPEPGETADIVLIDTANKYAVQKLDQTHAWNLQQGTMLYWNPDAAATQFFFNDLDPETGQVFTVLYDIAVRGRAREYRFENSSAANGGVAPGGGYFAGINYGKITHSRKVISYAGAKDFTADGPANPGDDGVFKVNIATGERELLVSYKELAEYLDIRDKDYPLYAHHTLWNRDNDRIFFIVRGLRNFLPNAGCVIHADGTGLKQVAFDGHPEWLEGKLLVLPGKKYFRVYDVDTGRIAGRLGGVNIFGNTWEDNALSPDGRWYAGSRNPSLSECVYTFYRRTDGAHFDSPVFKTRRGGKDTRIDPAPRWNRESDAILVPGIAEDGTRQLFIARIKQQEAE